MIEDWIARLAPGTDPTGVRAGDDADEARWVPLTEVAGLPCVDGLLAALRTWHVVVNNDSSGPWHLWPA